MLMSNPPVLRTEKQNIQKYSMTLSYNGTSLSLTHTHTYIYIYIYISNKIEHRIEHGFEKYLKSEHQETIRWVSWDNMCKPKWSGGMGFRDMITFRLLKRQTL